MLAEDLAPNRLERARREALALAARAREERLGLVLFAGTARLVLPPTRDRDAFAALVESAEPSSVPRGGSDLGRAVDRAAQAIDPHAGRAAAIVLLTDGEDLDGRGREAAARAAALGVTVHAIGFGTARGAAIPTGDGPLLDRRGREVTTALDAPALAALAEASGGTFLAAVSVPAPALRLLDQAIRPRVATVRAAGTGGPPDRYRLPLALAFLLWTGEFALARKARRPSAPAVAGLLLAAVFLAGCDRTRAGREAWDADRPADALSAFRTEVRSAGDEASPALLFDWGVAALAAKQPDEAAEASGRLEVAGGDAWQARAAFLAGSVAYADSLRLAKKAGNAPPEDQRAWLPARQRAEDALARWQRAAVTTPRDWPEARRNVERALLWMRTLREERGGKPKPRPKPVSPKDDGGGDEKKPPPSPEPKKPPPGQEIDVTLRQDELPAERVLDVLHALEKKLAERRAVRRAVRTERSASVARDW